MLDEFSRMSEPARRNRSGKAHPSISAVSDYACASYDDTSKVSDLSVQTDGTALIWMVHEGNENDENYPKIISRYFSIFALSKTKNQ